MIFRHLQILTAYLCLNCAVSFCPAAPIHYLFSQFSKPKLLSRFIRSHLGYYIFIFSCLEECNLSPYTSIQKKADDNFSSSSFTVFCSSLLIFPLHQRESTCPHFQGSHHAQLILFCWHQRVLFLDLISFLCQVLLGFVTPGHHTWEVFTKCSASHSLNFHLPSEKFGKS